ncbi:MAG: hypothetical protein WD152_00245, partial [Nitriliruptoraceae bacterium]
CRPVDDQQNLGIDGEQPADDVAWGSRSIHRSDRDPLSDVVSGDVVAIADAGVGSHHAGR